MKKIVIVEPDSGLSWLMCESLRGAGYEPVPCAAEQAVALSAELPADALVASLMAASVEQSPLYRALREDPRTKALPVIIITGRGDRTVRRRLGETPPHLLFKPFELEGLVAAVRQVLGD